MKISYFFVSLIALSVASSSIDSAVARPSKSYSRSTSSSSSYGSRSSTPSYTKSSGGYGASSSVSRSPSASSGGFWGMSRSQRTAAATVAGAGAVAYATHKADASTTNTASNSQSSSTSTQNVATPRTYTQPAYQYPSTRTVVPVPVPSAPTRNVTVNHYHNDNSDSSYMQGVVAGSLMSNMNHEHNSPQVIVNNVSPAPTVQPQPVAPSVPTATVVQNPPVAYNNGEHHSHWFMFLVVLLLLGGGIAGGLWLLKKKQTLTGHSGSDLFDEMTEKKDSKVLNTVNHDMPNLMVGNSISLSPIDVMNDPSASEDQALHFEPASTGKLTIVATGESAKKNSVDVFTAYGDEDIDFFRLGVNGTSIEDAVFYSLIDVVFPSNEDEWDAWMNDTSGMLGSASFMTKDNITWSRSLFPESENRMAPADIKETITTKDGKEIKSYAECEYERATGFGSSFAQKENLLVRQMTDRDGSARIELFAGVPVSPASLGFKLA